MAAPGDSFKSNLFGQLKSYGTAVQGVFEQRIGKIGFFDFSNNASKECLPSLSFSWSLSKDTLHKLRKTSRVDGFWWRLNCWQRGNKQFRLFRPYQHLCYSFASNYSSSDQCDFSLVSRNSLGLPSFNYCPWEWGGSTTIWELLVVTDH